MTGQTLLQPSRQIEAMIRGLTDAAQSLGSHLLYSHCCSSHWGRASTTAIRTAYTQFAVEAGKWTAKRNVSQCCHTQLFQIHKVVCEIRNLRSKVRWSLIFPTPSVFPPCRKWICTESFEKLPPASTADILSLPIHGNEEFAINGALPGGSAKQRGGWCGEKDNGTKLQTILNYLCLAWASSQEICWVFIGKLGHCTGNEQGKEQVESENNTVKTTPKKNKKQCVHGDLLCVNLLSLL